MRISGKIYIEVCSKPRPPACGRVGWAYSGALRILGISGDKERSYRLNKGRNTADEKHHAETYAEQIGIKHRCYKCADYRSDRTADRHHRHRAIANISRAEVDRGRCARGEDKEYQVDSLREKLTDVAVFG